MKSYVVRAPGEEDEDGICGNHEVMDCLFG